MENAHPIEIVAVNDTDHSFSLNGSSLNELLLQDDIKDRSVVVVSVAGAFRKGKSFLLNFFLRYLYAQYRNDDVSNWLGKDDEPLKGFNWGGGSQKITTGISMWSDIFTLDYKNGDKIAIILLDNQGTFDRGSTIKQSSTIFSLSTLLASVQCFNLMSNIQEDDLMNLNLFMEIGRLAREDTGNAPFQRLQFIVRDWSYPYEHEYGSNGGQTFLQGLLKLKPNMNPESTMLRKQIRNCFNEIECILMPHPGLVVATNSGFDGSLKDINHEFRAVLNELVPMLLAPEYLLPKKINGEHVKAHELAELIAIYLDALQTENDFNPTSVYMGLAEYQNQKAVNEAELLYRQLMVEICTGKSINDDKLLMKHRFSKEQSIQKFRSMPKVGTADFIKNFMGKLDDSLERLYYSYKKVNSFKRETERKIRRENVKRVLKTGAVAIGIAAIAILRAFV